MTNPQDVGEALKALMEVKILRDKAGRIYPGITDAAEFLDKYKHTIRAGLIALSRQAVEPIPGLAEAMPEHHLDFLRRAALSGSAKHYAPDIEFAAKEILEALRVPAVADVEGLKREIIATYKNKLIGEMSLGEDLVIRWTIDHLASKGFIGGKESK